MNRTFFLCIGFCIALAACGKAQHVVVTPAASSSSSAATIKKSYVYPPLRSKGGGMYVRDGSVPPTSSRAVLFFGMSGDALTERTDAMLRALYSSGSIAIPAYFVEYDNSIAFRLRHGVVTHDTLVSLNTQGDKQSLVIHPTDSELKEFLKLH